MSLIIIIVLLWVYHIYLSHPKFVSYEYDDLKHKFKTGDMILFHGLDNINPVFIGCYYGHVGIIYIDPDDITHTPYLFEAFSVKGMPYYPEECKNGVVLVNLEHRLNSYRGYCFYKELEYSIDVNTQRMFKELINYSIKNMYYNEAVFVNSLNKMLYNEYLHHGTNCAELTYLSLIKLGLIQNEYIDYNRKHHLYWVCNIQELKNNRYKDPVYIMSNYFRFNKNSLIKK